jgi:uncharacterized protein
MNERDVRNIAAARRMYLGDDVERTNIAPDIVWHVPGHNPVSGEYRGFRAYTELMPSRMAPLARWDFALDHVMVNGDMVVATFRVSGERKGRRIDQRGAHIMRPNEQGQVVEGWGFASDQAALDEFFAA